MFYIICRLIDTVFKWLTSTPLSGQLVWNLEKNPCDHWWRQQRDLRGHRGPMRDPVIPPEGSGVFFVEKILICSQKVGYLGFVVTLTLSHRRKWWNIYLCLTGNYY